MTPDLSTPKAALDRALQSVRDAFKPNALAFRLFAAAAIWSLIALPATGLVLNKLVHEQVARDFDQRLKVLITTLMAESIAPAAALPQKPDEMFEPLFKTPWTGWYWQIKPAGGGGGPTYSSESLLGETLKLPSTLAAKPGDAPLRLMWADVRGPEKERKRLRVVESHITVGAGEDGQTYSYAVAGPLEEVETAVGEFRNLMIIALVILGAGLLTATFFQVQFGLRPLTRIERGLAAIRSGEAQHLEGELPEEIKPLQHELNALILSNQDIVERARTQVGNLAHALKTPLSVITNEARDDPGPMGRKVAEQAEVMRDQVNLYLDRARMAARIGVIGGVSDVAKVAGSLARALTRIYADKNEGRGIAIEVICPADARFQGERQDLEEMLGNLMDNACKWASSAIVLTVAVERAARTAPRSVRGRLLITVDDDGPGLTPDQRAAVGKRGRRLDETMPGSGLGLSIVADLASLYRGAFLLAGAPQGGVRARLELPAA